nr:NADH dehydrogenase subunit 2 [Lindneromyia sp.]
MFKNSSVILFFSIVILGTTLAISSSSWIGAWMGLEINLLAFIPLMNDSNNTMSSEAALKYFLTQALASSVLLFAIIISMLNYNLINIEVINEINKILILSPLLLKSGAAPFHFWFPGVMEGLSWMSGLILMTWQKIAPLMLMESMINNSMFYFSIILSIVIGSLGGLNQTSLRKLMAFSSINHLGWMLSAMLLNNSLWIMYLVIYIFLSMNLVYFFNLLKLNQLTQLFSSFFSSKTLKFVLMFNFLSLGGLPPFLGFLPKWMLIQQLAINSQLFLVTIMVTMTLVTLYFYLRICYTGLMLNYSSVNWINSSKINSGWFKLNLILSCISTCGLFIVSILYFIL